MNSRAYLLIKGGALPCRRRSPGFTLVEMLVVITIIGMLMSLLLPAVQSARETGRRAQCMNNQHQLAIACLNYEAANRRFPGYKNKVGGADASWVVCLLPYVERADLWKQWSDPAVDPKPVTYLQLMICPSHPPIQIDARDTTSRYIINRDVAGNNDPNPKNLAANEIRSISQDYLSMNDGATNTVLLGETASLRKEHKWNNVSDLSNLSALNKITLSGRSVTRASTIAGLSKTTVDECYYSRNEAALDNPPSNHGGGALVAYCDGHTSFLRTEIDNITGLAIPPTTPIMEYKAKEVTVFSHICSPDGGVVDEAWFQTF